MHARPTIEEIQQIAAHIGVDLDQAEGAVYQRFLIDMLARFDDLVQSPMAERRPPLPFPERAMGHRPTREEDPYCAWLWRCELRGADSGLLEGKTIGYKDNVAVAGVPMTFGSALFEGYIPDFDATIASRTLEAGGTIIGKNALTGFTGDFALPINPHNPNHSAGGSSSGSAVALAAGEVDVCFGGDQGGSIRSPASYCGIIGLKPTFGLVSHMGATYLADESVDHTGPMARHAEDIARALQAVAGYDGFDPRQGRHIPESIDLMTDLRRGVEGLRIGVLEEGFDGATEDVRDVVMTALEVLVKAGATLESVSIPEHRAINVIAQALRTEGTRSLFESTLFGAQDKSYYPTALIAMFHRVWQSDAKQFSPINVFRNIGGELARRNFHGAVYAKAQNIRYGFEDAYNKVLNRFDVIAMPTSKTTAPQVVAPSEDPIEALEKSLASAMSIFSSNTQQFNYTGHPAISIPAGKSKGLPIGMQLVGKPLDDARLIQAAYAYEHLVDWNDLLAIGS
jgi:amidase